MDKPPAIILNVDGINFHEYLSVSYFYNVTINGERHAGVVNPASIFVSDQKDWIQAFAGMALLSCRFVLTK